MYNFYSHIKFKISLLVSFYNASLQFLKYEEGCGHLKIKLESNPKIVSYMKYQKVEHFCKIVKNLYKKSDLWPNLLLVKCFSEIHNILDLTEIFTTKTRLQDATFPTIFIENGHQMKEK